MQRGQPPCSHPADGEVLAEFETEISNCQHLQKGEHLTLQQRAQTITFSRCLQHLKRLPEQTQDFSHLIISVGENGILGVHQDSAGFLLNAIEGGGFHGDVRGLSVVVEHLGRHHILQQKRVDERRAGGELDTKELIIALKAREHLRDTEDDVGVLAALVGVYALPVVQDHISTG